MSNVQFKIVTHGGAGSNNDYSDGTAKAADRGITILQREKTALEAACEAVVALEDDGRFNAGVGSTPRSNNLIQMDAACMDSSGRFGAVAVIEEYRNPILIAHSVLESPLTVLAGKGAAQFASKNNFQLWSGEKHTPSHDSSSDTVGAVVFDGKNFAAALSTGGTGGSVYGRVGDVPLLGCGLFAGPQGAVAATGHGESITSNITAYRVYQMLEQGVNPRTAIKTCLHWFDGDTDIGLILVCHKGAAVGSNRSMAWTSRESGHK